MTDTDRADGSTTLQQQLAERDVEIAESRAEISDRDKTIAKLAKDVAMLQEAVAQLLAQRSSGHRVNEKQGLLFPATTTMFETPEPAVVVDAEPDDGGVDADQGKPSKSKKKGSPRKPGKLDTTGLPSEDRLHDLDEAARIDPVTGVPAPEIPRPLEPDPTGVTRDLPASGLAGVA